MGRNFVYSEPVSMGKSFKGLKELVAESLKKDQQREDSYVFFNNRRDYVKVLFWDGDGWMLLAKKLDAGIFPLTGSGIITQEALTHVLSSAKIIFIEKKEKAAPHKRKKTASI